MGGAEYPVLKPCHRKAARNTLTDRLNIIKTIFIQIKKGLPLCGVLFYLEKYYGSWRPLIVEGSCYNGPRNLDHEFYV